VVFATTPDFCSDSPRFDYTEPMPDYYLGVDVGGTKTEIALIEISRPESFDHHRILAKARMATDRHSDFDSFLEKLGTLATSVLEPFALRMDSLSGIGFGLPGAVHPGTQTLTQGSIPFFKGFPLPGAVSKGLGFSGALHFENDGNCFALAEARFGAGRSWAIRNRVLPEELCLLGVTLGTGVGGGIVAHGRLVRGRRGGAGEIGHMSSLESDHACYCGKYGCAEQFLSGPALEAAYRKRALSDFRTSGKQVFEFYRNGDPFARSAVDAYRDQLLRFLSNLSNLLDPHLIVLGGGLSLEPEIYEGLESRLSEGCFLTEDPPSIVQHEIGDAAGAIGAASLAFAKSKTSEERTP